MINQPCLSSSLRLIGLLSWIDIVSPHRLHFTTLLTKYNGFMGLYHNLTAYTSSKVSWPNILHISFLIIFAFID